MGNNVPTNLELALAKKLELEGEAEFIKTSMLLCFAFCLLNILFIFESPIFAAAVICTER